MLMPWISHKMSTIPIKIPTPQHQDLQTTYIFELLYLIWHRQSVERSLYIYIYTHPRRGFLLQFWLDRLSHLLFIQINGAAAFVDNVVVSPIFPVYDCDMRQRPAKYLTPLWCWVSTANYLRCHMVVVWDPTDRNLTCVTLLRIWILLISYCSVRCDLTSQRPTSSHLCITTKQLRG